MELKIDTVKISERMMTDLAEFFVLKILIPFAFAFADPIIVIPSFIVGWFVQVRSAAIFVSLMIAILTAFVMYELRTRLGDSGINLIPFMIKICVAVLITFVAHKWKQNRIEKKMQKK